MFHHVPVLVFIPNFVMAILGKTDATSQKRECRMSDIACTIWVRLSNNTF